MSAQTNSVPCLLWPFWVIWRLLTTILAITGRLIAAVLGFVLMMGGLLLTLTVIGAVVGIPMMIFGFVLIVRSLF